MLINVLIKLTIATTLCQGKQEKLLRINKEERGLIGLEARESLLNTPMEFKKIMIFIMKTGTRLIQMKKNKLAVLESATPIKTTHPLIIIKIEESNLKRSQRIKILFMGTTTRSTSQNMSRTFRGVLRNREEGETTDLKIMTQMKILVMHLE